MKCVLILAATFSGTAGTLLMAADAPELKLSASGKWESPVIASSTTDVAKLKAKPVLKADISVEPDTTDTGWFMVKLAINGPGIDRTESPKWLIEKAPGKAGIDDMTISWNTSEVVSRLPDDANWFKIELVTQGDHPRTITVSNLRAEAATGAAKAEALKIDGAAPPAKPAPTTDTKPANSGGPTPYPSPNDDKAWPGKGPIRHFGWMTQNRNTFWSQRTADQGKIVFVGDSIIGGWKLDKDFPGKPVANRGIGGDVTRGLLFRFQEDVLDLKPKAIVMEIGSNDIAADAAIADVIANYNALIDLAHKANPETPIIIMAMTPHGIPTGAKAPSEALATYLKKVNAKLPLANAELAKIPASRKNVTFADTYAPFIGANGQLDESLLQEDKVHPTAQGHTKIAEVVTKVLKELNLF